MEYQLRPEVTERLIKGETDADIEFDQLGPTTSAGSSLVLVPRLRSSTAEYLGIGVDERIDDVGTDEASPPITIARTASD